MKFNCIVGISIVIALLLSLISVTGWADDRRSRGEDQWKNRQYDGGRWKNKISDEDEWKKKQKNEVKKKKRTSDTVKSKRKQREGARWKKVQRNDKNWKKKRKDYSQDQRHRHNRYYPRRGNYIKILPQNHRVARYRNKKYYFHGGAWYRPFGRRFVVVTPPIGLTIPILPHFYTTVWFGDIPYYYAGGVYYLWHAPRQVYVVSDPPPEAEISEQASNQEPLYIYPKAGQDEGQQAKDRYECHKWGVEQTSYDPTQPGGDVSEDQHAAKRSDYYRAMTACLEGREYSVK